MAIEEGKTTYTKLDLDSPEKALKIIQNLVKLVLAARMSLTGITQLIAEDRGDEITAYKTMVQKDLLKGIEIALAGEDVPEIVGVSVTAIYGKSLPPNGNETIH